jgi:hypothetical protein
MQRTYRYFKDSFLFFSLRSLAASLVRLWRDHAV